VHSHTGSRERDADTTMIVGLSGQKRSGKDTIAAYLVKEHNFERKAFADPLKRSVAALFDIPFSEVDKLKLDPQVEVIIRKWKDGNIFEDYVRMNKRTFLQRYGTEAHRDVFGQDFWLDHTLPVQGFYPGRAIVVTDVRFTNEAARIRELGGIVVKVSRNNSNAAPSDQDQHRSEVIDFDWDYLIENDGSFGDLYAHIEDMLCHLIDTAEVG